MRNSLLLLIAFSFQSALSQVPVSLPELPLHSFIQHEANQFHLVQYNSQYQTLFAKFDALIKTGNNRINIVHIGGSHIQADIYTHRIRQEMQSFYPGILGARGFFFPYALAHTNSPSNLQITWTGEWQTSKNTQSEPDYALGLSGITSVLTSSAGSLQIVARYDSTHKYDFNHVKLFCNVTRADEIPQVYPSHLVKEAIINEAGSFVQYILSQYADTLDIHIQQGDSVQEPFQLYGISLENDDPGVVYNSIGVNGAKLTSYLRCGLFNRQLQALKPDWVILSIGTNEGNSRSFDKEAYRNTYLQLLDSVRTAVPGAAILLTVPNDCYLFKRYVNPNTSRIRDVIFDIAQATGCGVWDFYTVMGGLNSATAWYNSGLMNKDHIHFNKPGYLLKGDLFFSAFMNSWDEHLQHPAPDLIPVSDPDSHTSSIQYLLPSPPPLPPHIQHPASSIQHPALLNHDRPSQTDIPL